MCAATVAELGLFRSFHKLGSEDTVGGMVPINKQGTDNFQVNSVPNRVARS